MPDLFEGENTIIRTDCSVCGRLFRTTDLTRTADFRQLCHDCLTKKNTATVQKKG